MNNATELTGHLTPQQTSVLMGKHINTIRRWIKTGQLKAVVVGPNRVFVSEKSIEQFKKGKRYA